MDAAIITARSHRHGDQPAARFPRSRLSGACPAMGRGAVLPRLHEVTQGQVIAIDGKAAREALARAGDQGPLTLVSARATANHVCLGQVAGAAGSNELGALPKLLELLDLHGAIVTLDALGCRAGNVNRKMCKSCTIMQASKDSGRRCQWNHRHLLKGGVSLSNEQGSHNLPQVYNHQQFIIMRSLLIE